MEAKVLKCPAEFEDEHGVFTKETGLLTCCDKPSAENVARILNAHDDLVAALKEARKELDNVLVSVERMEVYFDGDEFHERLAKIDAALAKAEGQP